MTPVSRASPPGKKEEKPQRPPPVGTGWPITINADVHVTITSSSTDIQENIMALRDDVQSGFETLSASTTEVRNSVDALAAAITVGNEADAQRIAELEALIEGLRADDEADASTIASLQAIVDGINADNDAVVAALSSVNDSLTATDSAVDNLASAQ